MSDAKHKLLWEDNPYYMKYFWFIILFFILDLIGLIISFALSILWLLIICSVAGVILTIWFIIQLIRWKSIHYSIYQDEIIIKKGIISVVKLSILVDKIEFYKIRITLVDRLWRTGDVLIYTGEEDTAPEAVINDVSNIKNVEQIIKQILSA